MRVGERAVIDYCLGAGASDSPTDPVAVLGELRLKKNAFGRGPAPTK